MQWVSTFAYGASSLGRSRRLEVRPAESGPPSSRGTFGENSPHLLGNIEKGKSKKKSSAGLDTHSGSLYLLFPAPEHTSLATSIAPLSFKSKASASRIPFITPERTHC